MSYKEEFQASAVSTIKEQLQLYLCCPLVFTPNIMTSMEFIMCTELLQVLIIPNSDVPKFEQDWKS